VQDVVAAVMFLESASFVTGEILHVDKVPVTDQDLEAPSGAPP
jgi:hypothetical protein